MEKLKKLAILGGGGIIINFILVWITCVISLKGV